MWDLPMDVEINGVKHPIRNKCDYRVVLDVICVLKDTELTEEERAKCALYIFYEDIQKITDFECAINEMFRILNMGEEDDTVREQSRPLMDWEHDFPIIAPPISRVIGYNIRMPEKYTHWISLMGAYMEIGECLFSTVISIRSKKNKGKKLDKWEEEFYREHRKLVDLPRKLTAEEEELLNSEW